MLRTYDDLSRRTADLRDAEHRGDEISHDIGHRLEGTFVTPFDREDIHSLISGLDDVLDYVEEVGDTFLLYRIETPTAIAVQQAAIIVKQCELLHEALLHLRGFKNLDRYWIEVHRLENEGDQVVRGAIAGLFDGETDPIEVIKWKKIYNLLEATVDACEDVADHHRADRRQALLTVVPGPRAPVLRRTNPLASRPVGSDTPDLTRAPCARGRGGSVEGARMGIFEKARLAAEQAADEARRRAEGAHAQLTDPATQEKAKQALDLAGKQTRVGLGHARRGLSTAIDKIDPNILADMIIKATSLQERANQALRDKGSPYRVAEIGIAASIPPQVTFSIGRIDDPEQAPPAEDIVEIDRAARGLTDRRHGDRVARRDRRPRPRAGRRAGHGDGRSQGRRGTLRRRRSARPRRRPAGGSTARRSRAR